MKYVLILIALGICIALIIPSTASISSKEQVIGEDSQYQSITKEEIIQLTDEFMRLLVQETDQDYQVIEFNNKESLINAFGVVTTETIAREYVNFYFYEENGGLYIVPTDGPPWFNKQNDYDVIQLEHNKVLVKQENQTGLHGDFVIEMEFTFANQEWKITNITHH
ncbi:hypothetical protein [Ornithinibacillus bavariensis]|uniref:Uncharacterized protein n=1 Tax=Ornithinibacillus bavariensis TaxID=545502 RepID=A0A920C8U5_9BACI|nr:hypothetical protein [Ornithinibacillus bavariensis]GIO28599.1 hypothetical protein J43TS3_32100 [Ornithinibacillus bavariensis]